MFKFLSLFKKTSEDQIDENEYDLVETPGPGKDIVESSIPSATNEKRPNVPLLKPLSIAKPSPEALAELSRINKITNELSDMTADPQRPSGEVATSTALTSPDVTIRKPDMAETPNNHPLKPDLSLIHGYGDPEEVEPDIPVGVTIFKTPDGSKKLYWAALKHEGELNDLTHRTVDEAIARYRPQKVLTEGHATNMPDEERNKIIERTKSDVEKVKKNNNIQDSNTHIPEAGYAAYVAREYGIPSIGWEPTGNMLFPQMESRGYSQQDVIADAFMRWLQTIPLEQRIKMTEEDFTKARVPTEERKSSESLAEEFLRIVNKRVDPKHTANITPLTLDQFRQWYALHPLSENRRFLDVDGEDFVPRRDGAYNQVLACESGVVRDQYILKLLAEKYKEGNDRILLIAGNGHFSSLLPTLADKEKGMFGTPGNFTRLVNEDTPQQAI